MIEERCADFEMIKEEIERCRWVYGRTKGLCLTQSGPVQYIPQCDFRISCAFCSTGQRIWTSFFPFTDFWRRHCALGFRDASFQGLVSGRNRLCIQSEASLADRELRFCVRLSIQFSTTSMSYHKSAAMRKLSCCGPHCNLSHIMIVRSHKKSRHHLRGRDGLSGRVSFFRCNRSLLRIMCHFPITEPQSRSCSVPTVLPRCQILKQSLFLL